MLTGRAGSSPGQGCTPWQCPSSCLCTEMEGARTGGWPSCTACRCIPCLRLVLSIGEELPELPPIPTEACSVILIQAVFLVSAVVGIEAGWSCTWTSAVLDAACAPGGGLDKPTSRSLLSWAQSKHGLSLQLVSRFRWNEPSSPWSSSFCFPYPVCSSLRSSTWYRYRVSLLKYPQLS